MDKKRIGIIVALALAVMLVVVLQSAEKKTSSDVDVAMKVELEEIDVEVDMEAEWIRGFNAAICQFAPIERAEMMTIKSQKVNCPPPKGSGLVNHRSLLHSVYYKPIDTWLVPQQLAVEEATGVLHF